MAGGLDVFVELKATIADFQAKMGDARAEMDKVSAKGDETSKKLGALGQGLALGIGAAAVAVGAFSVDAANHLEDAHAKLSTSLTDAGSSFDKLKQPIADTQKKMEGLNFTNADTQNALAVMTTALGDPKKALDLLGTAADVAAYKQVPLADAAVAVAKGFEGNLKPLKQMGIDLPVVASSAEKVQQAQDKVAASQQAVNDYLKKFPDAANPASKAHAGLETAIGKVTAAQTHLSDEQSAGGAIIDGLNKKVGGQAAAAADTFSGKMDQMKVKAQDMGAQLGTWLIPKLEGLIGALSDVFNWLSTHKDAALEIVGGIGVIVLALVGIYVAGIIAEMSAATVATGGIILLVGLIAAGIIYLVTHWQQVWSDIKKWTADAVEFLRGPFGTLALLILGPLAPIAFIALHYQQMWADMKQWTLDGYHAVVGFFTNLWKDVTGWVTRTWHDVVNFFVNLYNDVTRWVSQTWTTVVNFFRQIWTDVTSWVTRTVNDVVNFFTGLPGRVVQGLGNLGNLLLQTGKDMIQGMIDGINSMVGNVLSTIGGVIHQILDKFHLGFLASPSSKVMEDVGKSLMVGLGKGITDHVSKATDAASAAANFVAGAVGSIVVPVFAAPGGLGGGPAPAGGNAALGQQMAAVRGWTGAEWAALNAVAMRESGWSNVALNASSGAYGIAQALPASKYPFPGQAAGGSDPATQIAWMLDYIAGRYGDPIGAWNHEQSFGWYDRGGWLPPGLSLALNTTGRPEAVGGGGGVTINVNVAGSVVGGTVDQIARALVEPIREALYIRGRALPNMGLA